MRRTAALIAGGGPAGATAAILLAAGGDRPLLIERQRETGDALCGGFLGWRTLERLEKLGIEPAMLGGAPVRRVRLFAGKHHAESPLPGPAIGLSRHRFDALLLKRAAAAGAGIERGVTIRAATGQVLRLGDGAGICGDALFLATGKHELRGLARDTIEAGDPWLGLRRRLPASATLARLVGDAIELHLFAGGYAGLVLQEDGSANLCLALRKSALAGAGGQPETLFRQLAATCPALGDRLAGSDGETATDAIAAIPYGWRARETEPGLFRLGDQAAVIASLAGEGIDIALASGMAAAQAWQAGASAAAPEFQRRFAVAVRRPIAVATMLARISERPMPAAAGATLARLAPGLLPLLAKLTRIPQ